MNYLAFLTYVVVVAYTPGPNTIMSMEEGKRVGFPRAFYFVGGVTAGMFMLGGLCAAVTALVMKTLPDFALYLRVLGTAYIVYLAVKILLSNGSARANDKPFSGRAAFFSGIFLPCLNVKGIMFLLTAFTSFVFPATDLPLEVFAYVVVLALACGLACVLWALCGTVFRRLFANHGKTINAVIALMLLYSAVSIWR